MVIFHIWCERSQVAASYCIVYALTAQQTTEPQSMCNTCQCTILTRVKSNDQEGDLLIKER